MAGQLFARGYPVSVSSVNQEYEDGSRPFLVDLPEYPFDHSQTYWNETRLSRDWRLREAAPCTLLGHRATDWNPIEPRWRSILSVQDIPWIAHHVVGDVPYLPGTGILMAALEAVKQTAQSHQTISGFIVKEITFKSPIVVRPEGRTEVITQLRPLQKGHEKSSVRFEVRTFACVDGYWNECSEAVIHIEYAQDIVNEVDGGRESRAAGQAFAQAYEEAKQKCVQPVSNSEFYKWHAEQGLKYGPSFSLTEGSSWDGSELGIGHINLASAEPFDGVAHPGVLDCAFQMASTAASRGMTKSLPAMIIHKLQDVWISSTGWQHPQTRHIRVLSKSRMKKAVPGLDCSFTMLSDDGTPLCSVQKFEMLPAGAGDDMARNKGRNNELFHSVAWKPLLSEMSRSQLQEYCHDFNTFFQLALHEAPGQRLLEVDGGSRGMTERILSILSHVEDSTGGVAFSEYTYTEASEGLLSKHREEYTAYDQRDRLHFTTFDIAKDISTQGLDQGVYSIIVFPGESLSTNTADLSSAIRNLRRALKPGGYLMIHGVPDTDALNDSSIGHSVVMELRWEKLLQASGFSGIDLVVAGPGDGPVIFSGAVDEPASMQGHESLLLVHDKHEDQESITSRLLTTTIFKNAEVLSLSQMATKSTDTSKPKSLIFLADLGGSLLAQMPEPLFKLIQTLVKKHEESPLGNVC